MAKRNDIEALTDQLLRVREFHAWVRSNVLFPHVPDTVVHPLLASLSATEHRLVTQLYDRANGLERLAQVAKATSLIDPI